MSAPTETEERLSRVPLFANLGPGAVRKLARLCIPRSYPRGTMIIEEGSVGLGLFLIASGQVEVFKGAAPTAVTLAVLGPGGVLGEMAVLDDAPRSASARALDDTECLLLTRDSFQTLLRSDPEIAWCLVPVLTGRVRELQARIVGDGGGTASTPADPDAAAPPRETEPEPAAAEGSDASLRFLRAEYAALMAAVTGMEEAARVGGEFLRKLAQETRLEETGSGSGVARRLPAGLAAASRQALTEAEKTPERVVASFLRHLRRERK